MSSTLRLIIGKLFAFFIHVFIALLVAVEKKSVQRNNCVLRLQDDLMYYNENENDNEKRIT